MKRNIKALVGAFWLIMLIFVASGCDMLGTTCTINFETNGGTEILPIEVSPSKFVLPEDPTKDGYRFGGWYLDESLELVFTDISDITDLPNEITLYAKWIENDKFELKFVSNGAQFGDVTLLEAGATISAPDPAPVRTGYEFKGWYEKEDGSGEAYTFTVMPEKGLTLYAKWEELTYTITFNSDGGSSVDSISGSYGMVVNQPSNPSKTGYDFKGWFEEGADTAYVFTTMPDKNITLKAQWEIKTYTISFYDLNQSTTVLKQITKNYGEELLLSEVGLAPQLAEYDFLGWYSGNVKYFTDNKLKVEADLNLYATFNNNKYYINFNYGDVAGKEVTFGVAIGELPTPTRTGYDFKGWQIEISDSKITLDADYVWSVRESLSAEAIWEVKQYKLTLDYNDDVTANSVSNIDFGGEVRITTPTRAGYTFAGWYENEGLTGNPYSPTTMPAADVKLYASWTINTYTVQFILEENGAVVYTYKGEYNSAVLFRNYIATVYQTTIHLDALYNELSTFVTTSNPSVGLSTAMATGGVNGVMAYLSTNCGLALQYQEINATVTQILGVLANAGGNITDSVVAQLTPLLALGLQYTSARLETNQAIYNAYGNSAYNPVQEGYVFGGWYYSNGINEVEFANKVPGVGANGSTINIYPKWIEVLATPDNLQVNDNLLTWDEVTNADKYEIYINGRLVQTVTTNQYTIPSTYDSASIEVRAISDTTYSYEVISVVDNKTKLTVTYDINSEKSATYSYIDIDTDGDVTATGDYYYKVGTDTFIFYTGITYNFLNTVNFTDISDQSLATANNNVLEIGNMAGDFTFKVNGTDYKGRIYPLITSFGKGDSLSSVDDLENSLYINKEASLITIGTGIKVNNVNTNGYKFDLDVIATGGKKLTNTALSYTFYDSKDLKTPLDLGDVAEYDEETDTFYFKESGQTYTVVITPNVSSYAVPQAYASTYKVEFTFTTNSGVNVTTNEQLKAAFADLSVREINILANIKAELSDDQWLDEEHTKPINKYDRNLAAGQINGDIYSRIVASGVNDSITINGNYFTIDGRELPFTDIHAIGNVSSISGYEIANVQIAIFKYRGSSNGTATYNNLMVIGNTETPSVNYNSNSSDVLTATELMNRNSGGYSGIAIRDNAKTVINNSIITQTTIAVYGSEHAYATIDQTYIDDSWANGVYGNGVDKLVLTRSKVGSSGGAALHIQDTHLDVNPIVEISADTEINNLVSGEEAWFKAYNMEIVALSLKSQLEGLVSPMNYTVLQTIEANGRKTEKFNFPFLFLDKTKDTSDTADLQGVELTLTGMPALNTLPGFTGYPDELFVQLDAQYNMLKLYLVGEETIPGEGDAKFIVQLYPVEVEEEK